MKIGTGQLVCLALGVFFLAFGGGLLGGRLAAEKYLDPASEATVAPAAKGAFGSGTAEAEQVRSIGGTGPAASTVAGEKKPAGPASSTASPYTSPNAGRGAGPDITGETSTTPGARIRFVIQVLSTAKRIDARVARDKIMAAGFPAGVFEANIPERGRWYRVYVGPYDTSDEARIALEVVRDIPGFEGSFVKALE